MMENVVFFIIEDNCVEYCERMNGENNEVVNSGNFVNVIDYSNNVIVECINCDIDIDIKKENCYDFLVDEGEFFGEGEF